MSLTQVRLTDDEIRAMRVIADAHLKAQARVAMAQEQAAEMIGNLKDKYGLDDSWTIQDLLTGFVKAGDDGNSND